MTEDSITVLAPPALPRDTQVSLLPVAAMQGVLAEYTDRRVAFRDWLRDRMVQGIHFGYPPGVSKGDERSIQYASRPSLYKAGAQLCCDLLKMRPEWSGDEAAWRMLGGEKGAFVYVCRLVNLGSPFFGDRAPGDVLGEGRGVFKVGEKKMQENSAIKMAEKRSLVDAVINTLAIADLFTQDIEPPEPGKPPEQDQDAPRVPTRAERASQSALMPPDVAEAVRRAMDAYKGLYGDADGKAGFQRKAAEILGLSPASRFSWTIEAADTVTKFINAEADHA